MSEVHDRLLDAMIKAADNVVGGRHCSMNHLVEALAALKKCPCPKCNPVKPRCEPPREKWCHIPHWLCDEDGNHPLFAMWKPHGWELADGTKVTPEQAHINGWRYLDRAMPPPVLEKPKDEITDEEIVKEFRDQSAALSENDMAIEKYGWRKTKPQFIVKLVRNLLEKHNR